MWRVPRSGAVGSRGQRRRRARGVPPPVRRSCSSRSALSGKGVPSFVASSGTWQRPHATASNTSSPRFRDRIRKTARRRPEHEQHDVVEIGGRELEIGGIIVVLPASERRRVRGQRDAELVRERVPYELFDRGHAELPPEASDSPVRQHAHATADPIAIGVVRIRQRRDRRRPDRSTRPSPRIVDVWRRSNWFALGSRPDATTSCRVVAIRDRAARRRSETVRRTDAVTDHVGRARIARSLRVPAGRPCASNSRVNTRRHRVDPKTANRA
jgi:hypothetical protein